MATGLDGSLRRFFLNFLADRFWGSSSAAVGVGSGDVEVSREVMMGGGGGLEEGGMAAVRNGSLEAQLGGPG
jgi:hypothetical protein